MSDSLPDLSHREKLIKELEEIKKEWEDLQKILDRDIPRNSKNVDWQREIEPKDSPGPK